MHDLRHAPRWSKTTVVVVLVVYGLVLAVGIFGLWAYRSDRDSSRQQARADAVAYAKTELEDIQREVNKRLQGLLQRVAGIASDPGKQVEVPGSVPIARTERLKSFLGGNLHGPFVRDVLRVQQNDVLTWFRGHFRMYDQEAARIEAESAGQNEAKEEFNILRGLAWEAERTEGAAVAARHWQAIAFRFPLATNSRTGLEKVEAVGVQYAAQMLGHAADALDLDPDALDAGTVHAMVLRALEIESLNWRRLKLDRAYLNDALADLNRELGNLLSKLPRSVADLLRWEVDRFRATRADAAAMVQNGLLMGAVGEVRNQKRYGNFVVFEQVEDFDESELYGIVSGPDGGSLVVRLDVHVVEERFVRRTVDEHRDTLRLLGMRAYVFRKSEQPVLPDGREPVEELELENRDYELPFRILVDRVGDPVGQRDTRTAPMFWIVIGLAAAGLVIGGRVLVRLLTREVRLAQLKADFVSNLSHELKTPITSISLFTEMLDDGKLTDPEEQREAFSVLADESQRLQRIVARMINVARGEARRNPFELEARDLNAVVMEVATRFRRITTEPGLDLILALFPEPLPIRMDEQAMDDAVTNLMSNAWKYKRGDKVRITVRTARRGRHAELVVSDDGVGIPREDRRRVFEMFYRANQFLTHPVAGTGLGLALVRNVVRGHKGTIRVEAGEGGRGAAFRLRFPLDLMGVAAEEQAAVATPRSPQESPVREAQPPAPHVTLPDEGTLDEAQKQ